MPRKPNGSRRTRALLAAFLERSQMWRHGYDLMMVGAGGWRKLAVALVQHAPRVLPGAGSPWAETMRRELDYIGEDPAALRWALDCILASYKARLIQRPRFSAQAVGRHAATIGVLVFGLALLGNASGQTKPSPPSFDETNCDLPGVSPEIRPRLRCGWVSVPRDDN